MPYADYKCEKCEEVIEFVKEYDDKKKEYKDFPEFIKCNKCGKKAIRVYGDFINDVPVGKLGNASTSYSGGYSEQYSTLTGKIGQNVGKKYYPKKS